MVLERTRKESNPFGDKLICPSAPIGAVLTKNKCWASMNSLCWSAMKSLNFPIKTYSGKVNFKNPDITNGRIMCNWSKFVYHGNRDHHFRAVDRYIQNR